MANLHRRITITFGAVTAGIMVVSGIAVFAVFKATESARLDNSLLQLARTEIGSATDTDRIHVHEPVPQALSIKGVPGYEKFVWIVDQQDRIVAKTSNVRIDQIPSLAKVYEDDAWKGAPLMRDIQLDGRPIRAVFYPFHGPGGVAAVGVVGVPSNILAEGLSRIGLIIFSMTILGTMVAIGVASAVGRSIAQPLVRLAEQAELADPTKYDHEEELRAPYREVKGVAKSFNSLLKKTSELLAERQTIIDGQRQFLADASHELRTPISNTLGTIDVTLRYEREAKDYVNALEVSRGEVKRMGSLVDDLLLLARSDLSVLTMDKKPVDIGAIVCDAIHAIPASQIGALQVQTSLAEQLVINLDPLRIRQVVDNLLQNSLSHANSRITVKVWQETDSGVLEIANDGPPLSPTEAEAIFERFRRLDSARARHTGGSGLGLAIAKAIVEQHHGTITAASDEEWTTFRVVVPTK
ncbi:MAG: hypothetical protein JST12_00990 [Armatimonadetes bacterium]|nr:hypothetical protein [Armatimonadota bacterium]